LTIKKAKNMNANKKITEMILAVWLLVKGFKRE